MYDSKCQETFTNIKLLKGVIGEVRIHIIHEEFSSMQLMFVRHLVKDITEVGNIMILL